VPGWLKKAGPVDPEGNEWQEDSQKTKAQRESKARWDRTLLIRSWGKGGLSGIES
jgi:hypothetical protein